MTTTKLRMLFCLAAAVLAAACGGSGDDSDRVGSVEQALAPPGSDAILVPGTFPTSFFPGERRAVRITMQNTGTSGSPANDWLTTNPVYQLAPRDTLWGWGPTPVPVRTNVGAQAPFDFIVTAPDTTQQFKAQMRAGTVDLFGSLVTLSPTVSAATVPQWGCTLVSSNVPTTLTPGETRSVTITVQNSGAQTWIGGNSSFALAAREIPGNFWGPVYSFVPANVAPSQNATFTFGIRAPTTPGTYSFRREMKSFGTGPGDFRSKNFCLETTITVSGEQLLNSAIVSTSFPNPMNTGATGVATVTLQNTGSQAWAAGTSYLLYSQSTPANLWGLTQVNTPTAVAPGENVTFTFTVTAPTTAGTFAQKWQMRAGGTFFGAVVNVPITVVAGPAQLDAAVVSQTIPNRMTAGKAYTFSIVMKNVGSTTWSGSRYVLFSTGTPVNLWGIVQVELGASETVATDADRTFNIAVTAPPTAGTYASSWRMRNLDVNYFGATALTSGLVVTLCGNSVINAGENCDDGNLDNGDGCSSTCQIDPAVIGSSTLLGSGLGTALGAVTLGDVTGDGSPELFVSEFQPPVGTPLPARGGGGGVYGFAAGAAVLSGSTTPAVIPAGASLRIAGADAADGLGTYSNGRMAVGEVTGDAIKDLVISASGADGPAEGRSSCGEVYVLQGGSALMSAGLVDLKTSTLPVAHIIGKNAGDGLAVVGVGDLTGDGQPDLVLGAGAGAGTIYIVSGGAALVGDIDLAGTPPAGVTVTTILGGTSGDHIGPAVALGDLNGDTNLDLLVGASLSAPGGRTRAGAAYSRLGPITTNIDFSQAVGSVTGPSSKWLGQSNFDGLGQSVAIGNVTGSATNEALIGGIQYLRSPGVQSGGVHVWSGVTAGTTYDLSAGATPTMRILGADANDDCGTSLALGDMNADGYQDIMFGCSAASGPGNTIPKAGEIDVIFGAATFPATYDLLTLAPQAVFYGAATNNLLGRYIPTLSAGDFNGDGHADFCAGTPLGGTSGSGRIDCVVSIF